MKTLSTTLTYSNSGVSSGLKINLEQKKVANNNLTTTDLLGMLAYVRQGLSAKLYRPKTCDVSILDNSIYVDIPIYVWPLPVDIEYSLTSNYGQLSEKVSLKQNREFDFVIDFNQKIELPFCVEKLDFFITQMPFLDSWSNEIEQPNITNDERYVYVDKNVCGALRISCVSIGYSHILSLKFSKADSDYIDNFNIKVSANYYDNKELQTETLDIELPGCLKLLLQYCEDNTINEHTFGTVTDQDKNIKIPVIYYSECTGEMIAVRYEKP